MKMINVYKSPISKEKYANLFLDKIPENVKSVCLLFIGHSETVHYIMSQKPEIQFTVIDGVDVTEALPYIYNGVNLKNTISFEDADCEEDTFLERLKASFENYNINMSFDLIIANPPFGVKNKLAKKVFDMFKETPSVFLCQPQTFTKYVDYISGFWQVDRHMFTDASLSDLCIVKTGKKTFDSFAEMVLNADPKLRDLWFACKNYNKIHGQYDWTSVRSWYPSLLDPSFDESKRFYFTVRTANNRVHKQNTCKDYKHNFDNVPARDLSNWHYANLPNKQLADICNDSWITFKTRAEFENFRDWWYREPGKEAKTFINKLLDLHEKVYGMSFGANCVLPHIDWSHPWTDKEILKEIGLPEDFLEEK